MLRGSETPRLFTPPRRELTPETSLGFEVCDFAARVLKTPMLPWQRWFLIHALELNDDGSFRFKTVLLLVARQNGKTHLARVLLLWRLFVDGPKRNGHPPRILGAAQTLSDAEDTWDEVLDLAESRAALKKRMLRPERRNGKRTIRLKSGARYVVRPLKREAGRGQTIDLLFLDELREHRSWEAWDAMSSTTLVPSRSQIIAASNAGDARSVVLRELRDGCIRALGDDDTTDERVGLFEWSAPEGCDLNDRQAWAQANPALGYTLTVDDLAAKLQEKRSNTAGFRTENLCQWVTVLEPGYFPEAAWPSSLDAGSRPAEGARLSLALDVSWDRARSHLAVCGQRADGRWHVELVASRPGTEWVIPWLVERLPVEGQAAGWWDGRLVVQARGAPASALKDDMAAAGVEVVEWGGPELSAGTGRFYDALVQGRITHLSQPVLAASVRGAKGKASGDATWIDRRGSVGDASPSIAAVAAFWDATRPIEEAPTSAYDDDDYELLVL